MSALLPLIVGLVALTAEVFCREAFALDGWAPDFFTVLVLWLASARRSVVGPLVACLLGLCADGLAGSPLGFFALNGLLVYYAALLLATKVRFQGFVGHLLLGAIGGVLALLILTLSSRVLLMGSLIGDRIGDLFGARVLLITVCCPPAFFIMNKLDGWLLKRPEVDRL
jgi:rod shape-determining protein MreD